METSDNDDMTQQRLRRKRVNKLKECILIFFIVWMVVSLFSIILLTNQMVKLDKKIQELEHQINQSNAKVQVELESKETNLESSEQILEPESQESIIDESDNLATENDSHKVYLTFDSVPGDGTNEILDILAEYQVKATFFVSGSNDENSAIYKRIVEEGHSIGMHSFSNQYSVIYSSKESFTDDLDTIQANLKNLLGIECNIYRFPGGSKNPISNVEMKELIQLLNQRGITFYDWNVSGGDSAVWYSTEDVVSNVVSEIGKYKTSIVQLQDEETKHTTVEALAPLIEQLQEMQVELLPIDDKTKKIQFIKADSVE